VSLIGDLAIGFDPHGADAAHFAEVLAPGCRIGSPPDAFNPAGQDWGLPPFSPWKLRAHGYEPFITTVRGALRGLQGLRIDHVMGFFRQYWIVGELGGASGAYVRFPADELLSILAIEATRAGAFVIGEDLGTVEPHVRSTMRRFGVLGTVVMWFEDADPEDYPSEVLATVSTHDLPTVAGVWGSLDGDALTGDRLKRILGATPISGVADVVVEVHRRLAAAPSRLKLVTLDDMTLAEQRPNVPGTTTERPNWCLPLPLALEDLERSPLAERVAGIMNSPADLPRS
jgi:4-alpha-glucanotransferase